jgi:hypothetical protein
VRCVAAPREEEITLSPSEGRHIGVNGFPSLLCQLKLHRMSGFLLPHNCSLDGKTMRSDVLDFQANEIAASQLAVDRQIEQR